MVGIQYFALLIKPGTYKFIRGEGMRKRERKGENTEKKREVKRE